MISIEEIEKNQNVKIDEYAKKILKEVLIEVTTRIIGYALLELKDKKEATIGREEIKKAIEKFYNEVKEEDKKLELLKKLAEKLQNEQKKEKANSS